MNNKKLVQILAVIFIVWGVLALLGSLFLALGVGPASFFISEISNSVEIGALAGGIIALTVIITLIVGALYLSTGIGLWKFKSWARILAIILSVLNLFSFPIGTILGICGLVILFMKDTKALFRGRSRVEKSTPAKKRKR